MAQQDEVPEMRRGEAQVPMPDSLSASFQARVERALAAYQVLNERTGGDYAPPATWAVVGSVQALAGALAEVGLLDLEAYRVNVLRNQAEMLEGHLQALVEAIEATTGQKVQLGVVTRPQG